MKNKELIKNLLDYNMEAEVIVVTDNGKPCSFSLAYGSKEGVTKKDCEDISIYIDGLCTSEQNKK